MNHEWDVKFIENCLKIDKFQLPHSSEFFIDRSTSKKIIFSRYEVVIILLMSFMCSNLLTWMFS